MKNPENSNFSKDQNQEDASRAFSRRNFLKGARIVGVGLAGMGLVGYPNAQATVYDDNLDPKPAFIAARNFFLKASLNNSYI